jgi:hypothetical protein
MQECWLGSIDVPRRVPRLPWLVWAALLAAMGCDNPREPQGSTSMSSAPAGASQPEAAGEGAAPAPAGISGASALPSAGVGAGNTPSLALAGTGASMPVAGTGASVPPVPEGDCPKFDSTYAAIQRAIFEKHGCTADACHGSGLSGGLDLRAGASYANLSEVRSQGSSLPRVQPGAPQESYLYLKLRAATEPGSVQIANSPMPIGLPALSANELEAIHLWIRGGAPQTGSVGDPTQLGSSDGIAARLNVCLPVADPIKIAPLEPPAAADGLQFTTPPWTLAAGGEREICIASYYDFSDRIPAEYKSPDGTKFYANGSRLRQDPGSHHFVLSNPGIPESYASDPAFGAWTCRGDRDGQACDPLDRATCGDVGVCSSELKDGVACIGYGPLVFGSDGLLTEGLIENVQASNQYLPPREGVYRELPIKGFLYHNMHAFNLTEQPSVLQGRLNILFAKDRRRRLEQHIDYDNVFIAAGTPPFTVREVCAKSVAPLGAEMIRLTSHTHKRGKRFWITAPDGTLIYENFLYADPLYKEFEPGIVFSGATEAARTLTACAQYNNGIGEDGAPDPETVTRYSRLPDRTACSPVACVSGKVGAACNGPNDHRTCDSAPGANDGSCDACPITGGPTTEDEMFVVMPWYVLPEGQ